jgi:hypothetical protein
MRLSRMRSALTSQVAGKLRQPNKYFLSSACVTFDKAQNLDSPEISGGRDEESRSATLTASHSRWGFGFTQRSVQGIQRECGRASWLGRSLLLDVAHGTRR